MIAVPAMARQSMAAALAFLSEGDQDNAERVLAMYMTDTSGLAHPMTAMRELSTAAIAICLQLGDAEVFRSLAGELATSEGQ